LIDPQTRKGARSDGMKPAIVSIVSKKNSGKTTLLEKLIPELSRRGYRVGTIKHDTHGFDIDHEGKDTWRHKQAGAQTVVISSPRKIALIKEVSEEIGLDDIVAQFFGDMDIVITEGYKKGGKPQIEVFRQAAHATPLHTRQAPGTLVAVVSDVAVDLGVPRIDVNDIAKIADFIEIKFISPDRRTASQSLVKP
jgi:molybdopterin-guanine dinucleotide biosynthesis adapter protein